MSDIFEDFFGWLRVHRSGYKMQHDVVGRGIDYGYIKACEIIEAELRRLIEDHTDGTDRLAGDKGLLDDQVP